MSEKDYHVVPVEGTSYHLLTAEECVLLADCAVRAREQGYEDIADLLLDRLESDSVVFGATSIAIKSKVNIDS